MTSYEVRIMKRLTTVLKKKMDVTEAKLSVSISVFVHGIRCYECSSYLDDKCGTTWGFSEAAGDKYLTECDETASGCKKLQYEEFNAGSLNNLL